MTQIDPDFYDAAQASNQITIAGETTSVPLQAYIAAHTDNVGALIALARNLSLHPSVQTILANSEHGLDLLDRSDLLSTPHASLLARRDLELYPARLILEENTPSVRAAILANSDSTVVRKASATTNVLDNRVLI